jgi:hypothetical protein
MQFLNNLRLVAKLAIPVAIVIAITVGLVALAKSGLDSLAADTRELVAVDTARLTTILQINSEGERGKHSGEEPDSRLIKRT